MRGKVPGPLRGLIIALLSLRVGVAGAQASEPKLSPELQARFDAGLRAESEGDCRGALEAYDDVARIRSTPDVRLHIAACEDAIGDLVRAVASYRRALAEAQDAGEPEAAKKAQDAVSRLAPRVPRLTVRVLGAATQAAVTLDGVSVSPEALRAPIAVNPGEHRILAAVSGRLPVEVSVKVRESESKLVEISLRDKPAARAGRSAGAPSEESSGWRTVGWVGLGVGAAALATSGVFFVLKQNTISDLEDRCGSGGRECPPGSEETIDRGRTYSTISNITLGVGLAAAAGGGLAIALTSKQAPADTGATLTLDGPRTLLSLFSRF